MHNQDGQEENDFPECLQVSQKKSIEEDSFSQFPYRTFFMDTLLKKISNFQYQDDPLNIACI